MPLGTDASLHRRFAVLLERFGEGEALLEPADLPDPEDDTYPYLRLIDPYGETIFSGVQLAAVIGELERLLAATGRREVQATLELARRCHLYGGFLFFAGD